MIVYQSMTADQVSKLKDIDRSETIDLVYETQNGKLTEVNVDHDCADWNENLIRQIQERYLFEVINGGTAIGAFEGEAGWIWSACAQVKGESTAINIRSI